MKVLIVIILVAIAGYLGYRILSKPKPPETTISEVSPGTETPEESVPVTMSKASAPATNTTKPLVTNKPLARAKDPRTTTRPTGEWKGKMELILASNADAQQKLQDLRELLSHLDAADAEAAVQELTTRVKDEGYAFLKPLAVDPKLPEPVRDEFMVDMMNRPNALKLPLFLEIARNTEHPDRENALDNLEVFTGLKYGADWNAWENGIQQWLKENPDRPRPSQAPTPVQANQ